MIAAAFRVSDSLDDDRSLGDILTHAMTEMGELALEIQIASGRSYKEAGADGVAGEAVDVIICMLDILRRARPGLTEDEITALALPKIAKWLEKSSEISGETMSTEGAPLRGETPGKPGA